MRRVAWATRCAIGLAIVICVADLTGIFTGYVGRSPRSALQNRQQTESSAVVDAFFSSYVEPSGRVVRRDQGGDTVSEGQAYALLLAVTTGNRDRFLSVWAWTQAHLQRPDGLLAWHWSHGRVADWMPAADADVDTAWALSVAGRRFGDRSLDAAARRMAGSILQEETVSTAIGLILVAGPWARASPSLVEPGYFSPEAFAELERATGDIRWARIESAGIDILSRLTDSGLPPDWVSVTAAGAVSPVAAPGSGSPPSFGLDAARAVVWGAACGGAPAALSAKVWARLEPLATGGLFPQKLTLDGRPETSDVSALIAIADAAAAQASGKADEASTLLEDAAHVSARYPTYYGSAWVALANSLLAAENLPGCRMR